MEFFKYFLETIFFGIIAIGIIWIKQLINKSFPAYMEEKGKNLATKQDIADITRKTEEVQREFKEHFELFSIDSHYKNEYYNNSYSNLYSKLYAIIIQSEYVREFIKKYQNKELPFEDYPFLEVGQTTHVTRKVEFKQDGPPTISSNSISFETDLSKFNKKMICDYIIEHADIASSELLKLAVSYRVAYSFYSGNPDVKNSSVSNDANKEELRLIREIVYRIVREYNELRRNLCMPINQEELDSGILRL